MTVTVNDFKTNCLLKTPDIIVQQYLIEGDSYYFNNFHSLEEEYIFKRKLSESLNIHIRDIVIVGSAKLGFSIKPEKDALGMYLFKDFDWNFNQNEENEKSDIDVAIVSSSIFDYHLLKIFKHTNNYQNLAQFGKNFNSFSKYVVKGWLRPDKIPKDYNVSNSIDELREEFKSLYGRKVNFGIYKSWDYFESYHSNNINTLKINLEYNS